MKKLKLKAMELGANEVLSRGQLKNVLGGSGIITTTGSGCYTSRCSITFPQNGGGYATYYGDCDGNGTTTDCFCSLDQTPGIEIPIGSNGGVSRCTK